MNYLKTILVLLCICASQVMDLQFAPVRCASAADIDFSVDTVADLTKLQVRDGSTVFVRGYTTSGDGGGQKLIYHRTGRSGITVDNGFYFAGPRSDDYYESADKSIANVLQFGADPTGVVDATAAIQAAIDAAGTDGVVAGRGPAEYKLSSELTVPYDVSFDFDSRVVFNADTHNGICIRFEGVASGSDTERMQRRMYLPRIIHGQAVDWDAATDTTSVGVQIEGGNGDEWHIAGIQNFVKGLYFPGEDHGCASNTFYLGRLTNNQTGIHIAQGTTGFVNSNNFVGGQIVINSAYVNVSTRRLIWIESTAGIESNNNRFYGINIESSAEEFVIDCEGSWNSWEGCRFEAITAGKIVFASGAQDNRIVRPLGITTPFDGSVTDNDASDSTRYNAVDGTQYSGTNLLVTGRDRILFGNGTGDPALRIMAYAADRLWLKDMDGIRYTGSLHNELPTITTGSAPAIHGNAALLTYASPTTINSFGGYLNASGVGGTLTVMATNGNVTLSSSAGNIRTITGQSLVLPANEPCTFQAVNGTFYQLEGRVTNGAVPEVLTTASPTLTASRPSQIDSSSNAVNGTLGSGDYVGQIKTITMTDATNVSTVVITNHEVADGITATFRAVDQSLTLEWTGTEWKTLDANCGILTRDGVVNVKAYGATGDGTTDDTAALAAAETALANGGTLLFPPGTYLTDDLIISGDDVVVHGPATLLAREGGHVTATLEITGSRVTVRDIIVEGNAGTVTSGRGEAIRVAIGADDCLLKRCQGNNTRVVGSANAFEIEGDRCMVRDCSSDGAGYGPMRAGSGIDLLTVRNFKAVDFATKGFSTNGNQGTIDIDGYYTSTTATGADVAWFQVDGGDGDWCQKLILKNWAWGWNTGNLSIAKFDLVREIIGEHWRVNREAGHNFEEVDTIQVWLADVQKVSLRDCEVAGVNNGSAGVENLEREEFEMVNCRMGEVFAADDGILTHGTPDTFTVASFQNFDDLGITTDHTVVIESGSNQGEYAVTAVNGVSLEIAEAISSGTESSLKWSIRDEYKYFRPIDDQKDWRRWRVIDSEFYITGECVAWFDDAKIRMEELTFSGNKIEVDRATNFYVFQSGADNGAPNETGVIGYWDNSLTHTGGGGNAIHNVASVRPLYDTLYGSRNEYTSSLIPSSTGILYKRGDKAWTLTPAASGKAGWICVSGGHGGEAAWSATAAVTKGAIWSNGGRVYRAHQSGTTGSTAPVHSSGTVSDDVIDWEHLDTINYTWKAWGAIDP